MKGLNKFLLLALVLTTAQSSAQQLILDGQAIDLQPGSQVTIEDDGDIVITSAAGDLTCGNVTTPPTVSLSVAPTSLTGSGNVTVSWTTQFADSCTPSNGVGTNWSNTSIALPNGQTTFSVSATTNFTLSCTNVLGSDSDSALVTVSTGGGGGEYGGFPPPADCPSTQPPPAGTSHEDPLQISSGGRQEVSNNFEGPFSVGWPAVTNTKRDIYIDSGKWLAMGFIAQQAPSCTSFGCDRTSGRVEWEFTFPDGPKVFSISRCPGDFSPNLGNCRTTGALLWSYNSGNNCVLTQGEQYYLNVIHGDDADPSQSSCGGSECLTLINVR